MAVLSNTTRSILVVDDEPSVRSMLQAVFESEGYAVTTAANASDAAAKLAGYDFDAVITDMKMETAIAGYDVVRAARTRPQRPVIVIMTAFSLLEQQWRDEGADAGLTKPVPVLELLSTIRRLIDERYPRP